LPVASERYETLRPRQRLTAFAAAALAQLGLALALLSGFRVEVARLTEPVSRLIDITLPKPPAPSVKPPLKPVRAVHRHAAASAPARVARPGGSPGPAPRGNEPVVKLAPRAIPAPAAGGGSGTGTAQGRGPGGGTGGSGAGEGDDGGADLVQIAGAILPSDYPRNLRDSGVGGRVGVLFTVGVNGRVTRCAVTRSSGVPELDGLTCRLIQERFRYRPSTDSSGRPVADEVEGEHDWIADRRD
jgi:protein TonB